MAYHSIQNIRKRIIFIHNKLIHFRINICSLFFSKYFFLAAFKQIDTGNICICTGYKKVKHHPELNFSIDYLTNLLNNPNLYINPLKYLHHQIRFLFDLDIQKTQQQQNIRHRQTLLR